MVHLTPSHRSRRKYDLTQWYSPSLLFSVKPVLVATQKKAQKWFSRLIIDYRFNASQKHCRMQYFQPALSYFCLFLSGLDLWPLFCLFLSGRLFLHNFSPNFFVYLNLWLNFFVLILYVPVNNFSVMSGRVFLGWTSTKQRIKCPAQGHNTITVTTLAVRLTRSTPSIPSLAFDLPTEPPCSAIWLIFNSLLGTCGRI